MGTSTVGLLWTQRFKIINIPKIHCGFFVSKDGYKAIVFFDDKFIKDIKILCCEIIYHKMYLILRIDYKI